MGFKNPNQILDHNLPLSLIGLYSFQKKTKGVNPCSVLLVTVIGGTLGHCAIKFNSLVLLAVSFILTHSRVTHSDKYCH